MKLNRNHWILLGLILFLTGEVAYHFWSHWGLITVHSKNTPLSQVIRSIEKQGHITIKTNLDLTKPVYMYVTDVALAEALETLATTTESRWRLAYVVGPDKGAIGTALAGITSGQRVEGWKNFYVPLMPLAVGGDEPAVLPDPRKDTWNVKPATEPTLQAYLTEASRNVSASFMAPENWNPPVKSPPSTGAIGKALPKLVSVAKGKYEEVFILQNRPERRTAERGDRERNEDEGPRPTGNFGGRDGFAARDERIQNEINKLPPDQRTAAQQEYETRKKTFEEIRALSPEDRAKRMEEFMNNPANQEKMDNAANQRDSRMAPDQRTQRAQNYLQHASAARAAADRSMIKPRIEKSRGGFTLLELMLVISIIAVLAGLIMPVTQNVITRARDTQCANNLRQIGVAANAAANDNNNTYPIIEIDENNKVVQNTLNVPTKNMVDALTPYGLTATSFQCPADLRGPNNYATQNPHSSYMWSPYSEDTSANVPTIYRRRGQSSIAPSRLQLASDWTPVHMATDQNLGAGLMIYVLYGDGHVKTTRRTKPKT